MEITNNLRNILNLLNATIVKRDNKLFIYDSESDTMERIERDNNQYRFKIDRENGTYHISYGYNGINITKDTEQVYFSSEGIVYFSRGKNSRYNDTYVKIDTLNTNFYESKDVDGINIEESIKSDTDLRYTKKSRTIKKDGEVFKEDIDIREKEGIKVIHHTERKYNDKGSLVTGTLYDEYLQVPVEVYVYDELANSEVFRGAFDKFNNFIPGIGYYCAEYNEVLKTIIKDNKNAIK